jgi:hypothetical protein
LLIVVLELPLETPYSRVGTVGVTDLHRARTSSETVGVARSTAQMLRRGVLRCETRLP